jgi:hypothetical protein
LEQTMWGCNNGVYVQSHTRDTCAHVRKHTGTRTRILEMQVVGSGLGL